VCVVNLYSEDREKREHHFEWSWKKIGYKIIGEIGGFWNVLNFEMYFRNSLREL
jgi:hypothetical protein